MSLWICDQTLGLDLLSNIVKFTADSFESRCEAMLRRGMQYPCSRCSRKSIRTSCSAKFVSYAHTIIACLCRDSCLPVSARRRLGFCVIHAVLQSRVSTSGRAWKGMFPILYPTVFMFTLWQCQQAWHLVDYTCIAKRRLHEYCVIFCICDFCPANYCN